MIKAAYEYIGSGAGRLTLTSQKANKSARVHCQASGKWSIQYGHNGAFKHGFTTYPEVLTYLQGKGW